MKFPYSQVHVHDGIAFAARSGRIESFNLHSGGHLSTWVHPDTQSFVDSIKSFHTENTDDASTTEPPSKRQKTLEDNEGAGSASRTEERAQDEVKVEGPGKKAQKQPRPRKADRPVIIQITGTTDGKHIVAVSGHDKAIWVFEHAGTGQLRQLSKRIMPKRPSTVIVGPGAQIIAADKFGDVYSLPLIPDNSSSPAPAVTRQNVVKPFSGPAANEFTVHSKRNLASLQVQRKHAELARQKHESGEANKEDESKANAPDFELTLLLGHVSMLTSMVLGENKGRPVIITGDRDEHVRVSRYIPQAHVIEGYCLGHKEFVNSLVIPGARGEILVSGGGDNDLFVWNWQTGSLLSKVDLLSLAQEVMPEATKVAVSKMVSFDYMPESSTPSTISSCILAICEEIKAIFIWHLTEANELKFPSIIQVPGNPLDLALAQSGTNLPGLVVSLDSSEGSEAVKAESLNVYELTTNEGKIAVGAMKPIADGAADSDDADIEGSAEEIKRILYGIESLRKVRVDFEGDAYADGGEGAEDENE